MHVIIATGLYPPEIGGPATFSVLLERGFVKHGISYTTIPFSDVRRFPKLIRHVIYFFHVLYALRSGGTVFALDSVSVGFPALLAARFKRAPFFLRVGGDYAWEQACGWWGFKGTPDEFISTRSKRPLQARILAGIQSFVARRARKVLTQSASLAGIVAKWGVRKERIAIVPNGATVPELPSRESVRHELGWGKEPIVISAGRFVPWKGFTALMDAIASLKSVYPDIRLLIAGGGPDEKKLKEHASKLSVRVEFLGNLPREELLRTLRAADVFALNTEYEGFSHSVLEAMAVGTPVVSTAIPGNKDLVEDGKTALAVPFNDALALSGAIRRLLFEKELAARIARAGEERARAFTPERCFRESCQALGILLEKAA